MCLSAQAVGAWQVAGCVASARGLAEAHLPLNNADR